MKLICEARCGRGAVRRNNQDNLFVNGVWRGAQTGQEPVSLSDTAEEGVYAVCDGMGGERYGEEASLLAAQGLKNVSPRDFYLRGTDYLLERNRDICRLMRRRGARIGTTFVGLAVWGGQARVINIGDSRAFLLRDGRLEQLSRDHTQTRRLMDMGIITAEQAATHPDRHRLTQHLGIFPEEMVIEPYVHDLPALCRGDLFLLCSDGLTDMLSDSELVRVLAEGPTLRSKADSLYRAAMQRGGRDNITVLLVQVI